MPRLKVVPEPNNQLTSVRIVTTPRPEGKGTLHGPGLKGLGPSFYKKATGGNPIFGKFIGEEFLGPNCLDRADAVKKGNWLKYLWDQNPEYMLEIEDQRKELSLENILDLAAYNRQDGRLIEAIINEDSNTLLKSMIRDLRKTLQKMSDKL